jgi:hypothetical protein
MHAIAGGPGLVGVVVALVGTTAYDGLSRTSWWWRTLPSGRLITPSGCFPSRPRSAPSTRWSR